MTDQKWPERIAVEVISTGAVVGYPVTGDSQADCGQLYLRADLAQPQPALPETCGECRYHVAVAMGSVCCLEPATIQRSSSFPACRHGEER